MPEAYLKGLEEADAARAKKAAEMAVPAKSGNVQAKSGKKAAETAVDLNVDPKLRGEFQTIEGNLLAIGQRLSKRRFVHVRRHPEVLENLEPVVRRAVVSKSAVKMLTVLQMIDPPELTAEEAEAQAAAIAAKPAIGSKWKKVGKRKPGKGKELVCEVLATALKAKQTFTREELTQMRLKDLKVDSFIKVIAIDCTGLHPN
ncbi:hypothetical protein Ctob_000727 [Chrysochromulina tobinii]|uniref:Uncharacterized protein n=1 Tax=Chrysochromulina tobinii TaxID=1460289 RepID=A0A0M0J793_9EUKA|nr:hypothetical protein Ctob_000727 [Chrysochromulina tobinii]|eukprot:KOO22345.1 hypothetical protein Ctob_000727 [Chrysochromulina sp. CCMP291]